MQLIKNTSQSEKKILIYLRPDIKISSDHQPLRNVIRDKPEEKPENEVNRMLNAYDSATGSDWFSEIQPDITRNKPEVKFYKDSTIHLQIFKSSKFEIA